MGVSTAVHKNEYAITYMVAKQGWLSRVLSIADTIGNRDSAGVRSQHMSRDTGRTELTLPPLVRQAGPLTPRQQAVVAAAQHAWDGYRKYAWGRDELCPISR